MSSFSTRPEPEAVGQGQESAWAYPRPPRLEPTPRRLRVAFDGTVIAETTRGLRVLETSHPPTYYFPPDDIEPGSLVRNDRTTFCEFKGRACYYAVRRGDRRRRLGRPPPEEPDAQRARDQWRRFEPEGAWGYDRCTPAFEALLGHVGFYADRMDACFVDDEQVVPQEGGFYSGWITRDVVGPFKGGPGTRGW